MDDKVWLAAPALRFGDTIMFVAPSRRPNKEKVWRSKQIIESMGFHVIAPETLFRSNGYHAGSDEDRVNELNAAIANPSINAIFPCCGGYGLTRILDKIDYQLLREHPKVITGFSDITALHLAISASAKLITFHSPMPEYYLWNQSKEYAASAELFWRTIMGSACESNHFQEVPIAIPGSGPIPKRLANGHAVGRLVGGNLTLVSITLGTPYAIQPRDNILLLEDAHEEPYRIDRYLSQLRLAGVLDTVSGIIFGTLSLTHSPEVDQIVHHYCGNLGIPVITNYPVGHSPANVTLPLGARVILDAESVTISIAEPPVQFSKSET